MMGEMALGYGLGGENDNEDVFEIVEIVLADQRLDVVGAISENRLRRNGRM